MKKNILFSRLTLLKEDPQVTIIICPTKKASRKKSITKQKELNNCKQLNVEQNNNNKT